MTSGAPAAKLLSAATSPKVPQNGTAPSVPAPGASKPKAFATRCACSAIARWTCITSFGPLVVPEVVNRIASASGAERSAGACATAAPGANGTVGLPSIVGGRLAPPSSTAMRCSADKPLPSTSARTASKSMLRKWRWITSSRAAERASTYSSSAARKRVLTDIMAAPRRPSANSSAIHSMRFTSHTATRSPGPMPCCCSHAAVPAHRRSNSA